MISNILQESNITELKASLNDKLEKEVVAFLNYREGGDIYFGVDDSGIPVPIDNTEDGHFNYVAWLLADNNGASIKVAKYARNDKTELIENEEYGYCSLVKAAKRVLDKLEIENRTLTKITSRERIDRRLVEPIALREAVINAFVHNDYSREVTPVFELFSDRFEITSYGGLPMGFSREDFFSCRSMPRNRELMRVFRDLGLVEQLGSGMSRILHVYDQSVFHLSSHYLVVSFPYPDDITAKADKVTPQVNAQSTPQVDKVTPQVNAQNTLQVDKSIPQVRTREEMIFEILTFCVEPRTRKEIADKCGLRDVRNLSSQYLIPLIEKGFLRLTIPDKPHSSKQKYQTVIIKVEN